MSALTPAALTATEWQQACQQRAAVYGWFSSLYAGELPAATLAAYEADFLQKFVPSMAATMRRD